MELKQIKLVQSLARHRHFGRAALELGLSQPALSKNLQALEHELGAVLFHRGPGDVTPTQAGEAVLLRAGEIVDQVDEISHQLDRLRGLETGRVRFGVDHAFSEDPVGPALGRFVDQHPGVKVEPSVAGQPELIRRLHLCEIEFCVVPLVGPVDGLVIRPLASRRTVLFCRPGHPLVGRRDLELATLLRYQLVAPPMIPATHRLFEQVVRTLGAKIGRTVLPPIEVQDRGMERQIVLASDALGIGILACSDQRFGRDGFVALDLAGDLLDALGGSPAAFVTRADREPSPGAARLEELIFEADSESRTAHPDWFTDKRFHI